MYKFCPVCGEKDISVDDATEFGGDSKMGHRMFCFNLDCPSKTFDNTRFMVINIVPEIDNGIVQAESNTGGSPSVVS